MEGRFYYERRVEFGDLDLNYHVNNVIPFRWFQEARMSFLRKHELLFGMKNSCDTRNVIAQQSCRYLSEIRPYPIVRIYVSVASISRRSYALHYACYVIDEDSKMQASKPSLVGETVVVVLDAVTRAPIEIPERYREQLKQGMEDDPELNVAEYFQKPTSKM